MVIEIARKKGTQTTNCAGSELWLFSLKLSVIAYVHRRISVPGARSVSGTLYIALLFLSGKSTNVNGKHSRDLHASELTFISDFYLELFSSYYILVLQT